MEGTEREVLSEMAEKQDFINDTHDQRKDQEDDHMVAISLSAVAFAGDAANAYDIILEGMGGRPKE